MKKLYTFLTIEDAKARRFIQNLRNGPSHMFDSTWLGPHNVGVSGGAALGAKIASASDKGIHCAAAAIHQEPIFTATPQRVYDALTDAKQFQQVQLLSAAMKSMDLASKPAEISREPGGAIKLFGGYVSGRQIELEPGKRIVQVWRAESWPAHIYSIVKFDLVGEGSGTKINFDHTGFPVNETDHLAAGWKSNYWDSLARYLK